MWQVRLFEDIFPFNLVVRNPITRAVSIVVFLALLIPFTIQATRIEAQTSAENFLPEDHPFQRFITASSEVPPQRSEFWSWPSAAL
jgi:hypothetical protein